MKQVLFYYFFRSAGYMTRCCWKKPPERPQARFFWLMHTTPLVFLKKPQGWPIWFFFAGLPGVFPSNKPAKRCLGCLCRKRHVAKRY